MAGQTSLRSVDYFSFDKDGESTTINNNNRNQLINNLENFGVEIYFGMFEHAGYFNDYQTFSFFQNSRMTDEIKLDGWKLRFVGPIVNPIYYNQYNVFRILFISPDNEEHVINLGKDNPTYINQNDIN